MLLCSYHKGVLFASSLAVTLVDTFLYYITILYGDIRDSIKKDGTYSLSSFFLTCRNLLVEFGVPEIIQSFLVYPLFLSLIPRYFVSYSVGLILAMIAANILFYVCVIPLYEWRKKTLS